MFIPKVYLSLSVITDWAEEEVLQGNSSESLLILASLGLDSKIDPNEVQLYLERYLIENHLQRPSLSYSCLVFLRITFKKLACSETLEAISDLIYEVFFRWYDFDNRYFNNIYHYWTHMYYLYFDYYIDVYHVDSNQHLSEEERFNTVKAQAKRFYDLLNNRDMLAILSK